MKKNSISKAISSAACLLLCTAIFASCTFGPAKTVTSSVETTGTVNEINETNGTNETKTAETVKSTYLYELDGLGMSIFDPFAFVEENVKDDSGKALTAVETVYAGEKTIWILCKNDDSGVYACAYDVEKNEEVKKYRLDGASAKIAVYDLGDGGSDAVCLISTYVRGSGDTLVKNHFYEMRIPDASPENASFVDILDDSEKIESYIEDGFDEDFGFGWADPKYTKLDNGKYVAEVKNGTFTVTKKSVGRTLNVIVGEYDDYEAVYIPTVFVRKFIGSDSIAFVCYGGDAEGTYIFDCVKEKTSYLGSFSPVRAGEWLICGDGNNSAAYAVNTALPNISRSIFTDRYKGYSPEIRGNWNTVKISLDGKNIIAPMCDQDGGIATLRVFDLEKFRKDAQAQDGIDTGVLFDDVNSLFAIENIASFAMCGGKPTFIMNEKGVSARIAEKLSGKTRLSFPGTGKNDDESFIPEIAGYSSGYFLKKSVLLGDGSDGENVFSWVKSSDVNGNRRNVLNVLEDFGPCGGTISFAGFRKVYLLGADVEKRAEDIFGINGGVIADRWTCADIAFEDIIREASSAYVSLSGECAIIVTKDARIFVFYDKEDGVASFEKAVEIGYADREKLLKEQYSPNGVWHYYFEPGGRTKKFRLFYVSAYHPGTDLKMSTDYIEWSPVSSNGNLIDTDEVDFALNVKGANDSAYKSVKIRFEKQNEEGHPERVKYKATVLTEGFTLENGKIQPYYPALLYPHVKDDANSGEGTAAGNNDALYDMPDGQIALSGDPVYLYEKDYLYYEKTKPYHNNHVFMIRDNKLSFSNSFRNSYYDECVINETELDKSAIRAVLSEVPAMNADGTVRMWKISDERISAIVDDLTHVYTGSYQNAYYYYYRYVLVTESLGTYVMQYRNERPPEPGKAKDYVSFSFFLVGRCDAEALMRSEYEDDNVWRFYPDGNIGRLQRLAIEFDFDDKTLNTVWLDNGFDRQLFGMASLFGGHGIVWNPYYGKERIKLDEGILKIGSYLSRFISYETESFGISIRQLESSENSGIIRYKIEITSDDYELKTVTDEKGIKHIKLSRKQGYDPLQIKDLNVKVVDMLDVVKRLVYGGTLPTENENQVSIAVGYSDKDVIWFGVSSRNAVTYICAYDVAKDALIKKIALPVPGAENGTRSYNIDLFNKPLSRSGNVRFVLKESLFTEEKTGSGGNGTAGTVYTSERDLLVTFAVSDPAGAVVRDITDDPEAMRDFSYNGPFEINDGRIENETYAAYHDEKQNLIVENKVTGEKKIVWRYTYDERDPADTFSYASIGCFAGKSTLLATYHGYEWGNCFMYDCETGKITFLGEMVAGEYKDWILFVADKHPRIDVFAVKPGYSAKKYSLFTEKYIPVYTDEYFESNPRFSMDGRGLLVYMSGPESDPSNGSFKYFDFEKFAADRWAQDGIDTGLTFRMLSNVYEENKRTVIIFEGDGYSFSLPGRIY